jgi:hypothetical protein
MKFDSFVDNHAEMIISVMLGDMMGRSHLSESPKYRYVCLASATTSDYRLADAGVNDGFPFSGVDRVSIEAIMTTMCDRVE